MNKKILIISIVSMTILATVNICFANTELRTIEKQSIVDCKTADEFYNSIEKGITENKIEYELENVDRIENFRTLTKEQEKIEEQITITDNLESTINLFNETKAFEENGYTGILNRDNSSLNIKIKDSYQEEYKVYLKKTYNNVSSNELNDIPKEIKENGITYYLVNPVWDIIETEKIDNNSVPSRYNGTMYYEGVKSRNIITSYVASVKYTGILEKQVTDTTTFKIKYKEVQKNKSIIPMAVATSSGIIFFCGIILISLKNVKIYNKQNEKYKLIRKIHMDSKNLTINLTPIKIETRCYKIVLSKKLFKKIKDKTIIIKYFDKIYKYQINEQKFEIYV